MNGDPLLQGALLVATLIIWFAAFLAIVAAANSLVRYRRAKKRNILERPGMIDWLTLIAATVAALGRRSKMHHKVERSL